ncbi:MAG: hypothetical protein U5N86_06055 [Planctomycetota bacterium]|nr:hypothetical protein [Planctomycetota bacterium]
MAWQVTVFLTTLFIAIAFLLVRFVVRSRKQEEELEKARARPDADEEVRVVLHELKNAMTLTDNVAQVIQDKGFNEKRFRMMLDGLGRFSEIARIAGERSGGKRTQLASVVDEALQAARLLNRDVRGGLSRRSGGRCPRLPAFEKRASEPFQELG